MFYLLDLPEAETLHIYADSDRIGQVVTNYLTNALKYSAVDQHVHVGIALQGREVRVWVRDRGPGLSPDAQKLVWQQFYQVPTIQSQSGSVVGLGLYICKNLILRHQGQVGVESERGQGSTFWFTLPLFTQEESTPPEK